MVQSNDLMVRRRNHIVLDSTIEYSYKGRCTFEGTGGNYVGTAGKTKQHEKAQTVHVFLLNQKLKAPECQTKDKCILYMWSNGIG